MKYFPPSSPFAVLGHRYLVFPYIASAHMGVYTIDINYKGLISRYWIFVYKIGDM